MAMTDTVPAVEVSAPALVPYPFGLFSVAPAQTPASQQWTAGVWWRSVGCNLAGVTSLPCSVDDPVPEKDVNVSCGLVTAKAFTVYARSDESVGGSSLDEKYARARDVLLGGEQYAAEKFLWTALEAATPTAEGAAGSIVEAVAMAEGLIADNYGGSPVLHMSRYTATMAHDVLHQDGRQLRSVVGSPVVAGGGYLPAPKTGTEGMAATVIATGGLVVIRGEIFDLGETIDTATNSVSAVVERTYVVGWDCAAVQVSLSGPV